MCLLKFGACLVHTRALAFHLPGSISEQSAFYLELELSRIQNRTPLLIAPLAVGNRIIIMSTYLFGYWLQFPIRSRFSIQSIHPAHRHGHHHQHRLFQVTSRSLLGQHIPNHPSIVNTTLSSMFWTPDNRYRSKPCQPSQSKRNSRRSNYFFHDHRRSQN